MGKLIVSMWTTLDGFIGDTEGPNFVLDDDEMAAYETALVNNADTLLLGRQTYQDFVSYWPNRPNDPKVTAYEKTIANAFNAMRKFVVSKSLTQATWQGTNILKDIVPKEIEKIKKESDKNIIMYGSASIVQQLMKLGLMDEYQLLVHPLTLGSGVPLFKDRVNLNLVKAEQFKSGVMFLTYQPRQS